jgi:hypothetical protein
VHLLGDALFGFVPPVQQGGGGGSGHRAGDPEPRNDLMPDLPRESMSRCRIGDRFLWRCLCEVPWHACGRGVPG